MRQVKQLYISFYLAFLSFTFTMLSFLTTPCYSYEYQVSICAIFQNEARFMKEWIEYHRKLGVEHFWLYNNNSNDEYLEILQPYISHKIVDLIQWPSHQNENDWFHYSFQVQTGAYNDALSRSRGKTRWLAIIDLDEFILPMKKGQTIKECLIDEYELVSGVCVNWQHFGTSNILKLGEDDSLLANMLFKMLPEHEKNKMYKSIVKPHHVAKCENPHYCFYKAGHWHVNANKEQIGQENTGVYIDKIRINHYWTRDKWYLYNVKIPRYIKWGVDKDAVLRMADEMNQMYDDAIIRLTDFKLN